jgi:hypothetical protein
MFVVLKCPIALLCTGRGVVTTLKNEAQITSNMKTQKDF